MRFKLTIGTMLASSMLLAATPIMAQTATSSSRAQINQAQRIANAKTKADNEINRRVTDLNGLITTLNNFKRLPASNKSSLTSGIQTQITSLTNLEAKINSDTDINTLKTDIQSIINSFRIYILYIPQIHLLAGSDLILQASTTFNDIAGKLQTKIQAAQSAGQNVSSLNASLADMQAKIADAQTQANNAMAAVTPLQPGPDPQTFIPTLQSARKMLQTARGDLDAARQDARSIIIALKGFKQNASSSSSAVQK